MAARLPGDVAVAWGQSIAALDLTGTAGSAAVLRVVGGSSVLHGPALRTLLASGHDVSHVED